jgi:SAM-dependent methyltransferase
VQTEDFARAEELFDAEYAYFSSYSSTWLRHAQMYLDGAVERFGLGANSRIVEIAANDGYLLQFALARGIPCTGVEPTASTAQAARAKGIDIVEEFFGEALAHRMADQGLDADLMIANNVLAHVPDINDFVAGFRALLKPDGAATFEFPHLLKLLAGRQFDTIYHEHFSYLSLTAVGAVFGAHGLSIFDVEELPTHGGSLRVYVKHSDCRTHASTRAPARLLERERAAGMRDDACYSGFQAQVDKIKNDFLKFLIAAREDGKIVAAYGAAAKGSTLMNYAGVKRDLLSFVADRNPAKQGKFMPGSRIEICAEDRIREVKPHYVVIFPWNLRDEIVEQLRYVREWGAQFVVAIPELEVLR